MRTLARKWRVPLIAFAVTLAGALYLSWPEQVGDPDFDAGVHLPAYPTHHPKVFFDEGHFNVHKTGGRYKPFVDLIRNDGYEVAPISKRLDAESLAGADILVIANALGFRGSLQQVANLLGLEGKLHLSGSAFSAEECDAVRDWVRQGGALLLIADHAPAGEAAGELSRRFGVEMTYWYAEDGENHEADTNWGFLIFTEENGLLTDHPIKRGRNEEERVRRVITFTGQSLKPPAGGASILKTSKTAREYPKRRSADWGFRPAPDLAQCVALEFGRGRVVILGEAAAMTAQKSCIGNRTFHFGMTWPGYDNRQFALNIMHWLSRLI